MARKTYSQEFSKAAVEQVIVQRHTDQTDRLLAQIVEGASEGRQVQCSYLPYRLHRHIQPRDVFAREHFGRVRVVDRL